LAVSILDQSALKPLFPSFIPLTFLPSQSYKNTMEQNNQQQNQLNIELSEDMAEGLYSNLAIITHSNAEFVVDFINVMPGAVKAKVKSRIVLTPQHAKRLLKALAENVKKFEQANGVIKDLEPVSIPMQFGGPTAQA
jgi:hypothetical protein